MANIAVDTNGNPWVITTTGGTLVLPYTLIPAQNTPMQGQPNQPGIPYSLMPLRIRWVTLAGAPNDGVIITDWKGRKVLELYATGADFQYDVTRPKGYEAYIGPIITQFDSGALYLYL